MKTYRRQQLLPPTSLISTMARRRATSPAPESQQVLARSRVLEKPKNSGVDVQHFRATIVENQKKLNGLIAKRKLQA